MASCWPLQPGSGCFSSFSISAPLSGLRTAELTYRWLCSASCVPRVSSLNCATKTHLANISVCWVMRLTSSYNPWGSISWDRTCEREVQLSLCWAWHPLQVPLSPKFQTATVFSLLSSASAPINPRHSSDLPDQIPGNTMNDNRCLLLLCESGPPGSDKSS